MLVELGLVNVDKIYFIVVFFGCSFLNSFWINGLLRLLVVNNWYNIFFVNFYFLWKWLEMMKDRLYVFLECIFELRNVVRKLFEYGIWF